VDFGLAVLAFETAVMLVRMLLLRSLIERAALRAGKYHRDLSSAGHTRNMHPHSRVCQQGKGAVVHRLLRCPDHVRLFDLEALFTCQACGAKGAAGF
jgi:hypothetical protein